MSVLRLPSALTHPLDGRPGQIHGRGVLVSSSGGTEIQVWMSEATSKFGIVFGAEFAWLQKRKILKRLGAEPVPSIER